MYRGSRTMDRLSSMMNALRGTGMGRRRGLGRGNGFIEVETWVLFTGNDVSGLVCLKLPFQHLRTEGRRNTTVAWSCARLCPP